MYRSLVLAFAMVVGSALSTDALGAEEAGKAPGKPTLFGSAPKIVRVKIAPYVEQAKQGLGWLKTKLEPVETRLAPITGFARSRTTMLTPALVLTLPMIQKAQAAGLDPSSAPLSNGQIAALVGGATAVAGIAGGCYLYVRGRRNDKNWAASPSCELMQKIEGASSPEQLAALLGQARGAHQTAIAHEAAISAGKKPKRKDRRNAAQQVAFAGLAATYATLLLNGASNQAGQRVGGRTASAWTEELRRLETEAISQGSEGNVGLALESLRSEMDQQQGSRKEHAEAIAGFKGQVKVFSKGMRSALGRVELAAVGLDQEIEAESALIESKSAAMRTRVGDRLAGGNKQYQQRSKRLERLDELHANKLKPLAGLAADITRDLNTVKSKLSEQQTNQSLASMNTHVYAGREQTGADPKGNPIYRDKYEDRSGWYMAMATQAAMEAQEAAFQAQNKIAQLNQQLGQLRDDPQLKAEGLTMPKGSSSRVSVESAITSLHLPVKFGWLASWMSSEPSSLKGARTSFSQVRSAIDGVVEEVSSRRKQVRQELSDQIESQLQHEITRARSQLAN